MVTVEASDMAQQISETGSVSLYGIFFDTNSASVRADSEKTLQEIGKLFDQQPELNLLVVGHTVSYASPVSSNATAEGQALNRRVELVKN